MKKWENFCKDMNEGLNNPVDIKWVDKGSELGGFFIISDKVYNIMCKNIGDNIWTYKFYKFDNDSKKLSPELTNDKKNVFSVLPTVESGFYYLIESKDPSGLIYGALDKSEGRKKIYDLFSKKILEKYGFIYRTNRTDNRQIYILYKPNIDAEVVFSKVREIIEENIDEI